MTFRRALPLLAALLSTASCATVTPLPGGRLVEEGDLVGSVGGELSGAGLGFGTDSVGFGIFPDLWLGGRYGVTDGVDGGLMLSPFAVEADGRLRLFSEAESALAVGLGGMARAALWDGFSFLTAQANYRDPASLRDAFQGVSELLLISSNELGQREVQHRAVIDAAVASKVSLLAYTSLLHADRSTLGLAKEHLATEQAIRASGLPFTLLRNGWYLENHTENLGAALQHGVLPGAAKDGRIAAASRRDFAEAAAAVLTGTGHEGRVYELAGDAPFTMTELAAVVAELSGKPVRYQDLPGDAYRQALLGFGLPPPFAELLADSDVGIANGQLDDAAGELRRLIGRPTTSLRDAVAVALR